MSTRRTLSDSDTFATKFIYPAFGGIAFVVATGFMWWWSLRDKSGLIALAKWLFPVMGVVTVIYGVRYGRRFKRVGADDQALYISDYRNEIRVPFAEIENAWVKWKLTGHGHGIPIVTIEFLNLTVFGKQIEFIAKQPWITSHSLVEELREWRDRARS
jgi:hypothetical protein